MIPSAVFVPAVALQTKFSLSTRFLRNLGSMPRRLYTCFVDLSKDLTSFLVKSFGECCGCAGLTAACYWSSGHCITAQKFVSVSGET